MGSRTTSRSVPPRPSDSSSLRSLLSIRPSWKDPHLPIDISDLPRLPEIRDSARSVQALTHPNYFYHPPGRRSDLSIDEMTMLSYEPLEVIGDRQLGISVALALHRQFPFLTPGPTSTVISRLVANHTLSFLGVAYCLDRRMRTSSTADGNIGSSQKIAADLFEAHIGGLVLAGQTRCAEAWLNEVFSPRVFPSLRDFAVGLMDAVDEKRIGTSRSKRKAEVHGKLHLLDVERRFCY
ncbi:hypothetical protein JCM16303_002938 [Sporobolomyces ruberrimus]